MEKFKIFLSERMIDLIKWGTEEQKGGGRKEIEKSQTKKKIFSIHKKKKLFIYFYVSIIQNGNWVSSPLGIPPIIIIKKG